MLLVVVREAGGFRRYSLENVVDKGVHDAHGFGGDTSVGMDLLQDLVDVDRVALLAGLLSLLGLSALSRLECGFLFPLLGSDFSWHGGGGLVRDGQRLRERIHFLKLRWKSMVVRVDGLPFYIKREGSL